MYRENFSKLQIQRISQVYVPHHFSWLLSLFFVAVRDRPTSQVFADFMIQT